MESLAGFILSLNRGTLLAVLLSSSLVILVSAYWARKRQEPSDQLTSSQKVQPQSEKDKREWGEWPPVSFSYPKVTPSPNPMDMKPIPYRPFRWGAYHVTMGIRDMPWDEWIELDNQMQSYYRIKNHRIATRGTNVVRILPDRPGIVKSASQSAVELVHELADYLSKRYPDAFVVSGRIEGVISTITAVPVNATFHLPPPLAKKGSVELRDVGIEEAEDAMRISSLLVQDDLALMVEGTDGRYYFQGGGICVPGFWRMRDKIGLPLEDIHIQGNVPQYETKLHHSMDRYFKRMPVDKPIIRNNYFFQVVPPKDSGTRNANDVSSQTTAEPRIENDAIVDPEELAWSTTTNGSEETFSHGHRYPSLRNNQPIVEPENDAIVDPEELAWSTTTNGSEETFHHGHPIHPDQQPVVTPSNLRLRTERQTLRRLPLSGAIVFTIRTYLFPVESLAREPGIPARMASALRSWPEDVRRYKGNGLYEKVMLEFLDGAVEEQRESGEEVVVKDSGKGYPY